MDNFSFNVVAEGDSALKAAIALVFQIKGCEGTYPRGGKRGVSHYSVRQASQGKKAPDGSWAYGGEPRPLRLVFFDHFDMKHASADKVALPFRMDAEGASDFARRWLDQVDYGPEPDHDGDNGKGWRVYNESWGHIDSDHNAVIAISPAWAMYGK